MFAIEDIVENFKPVLSEKRELKNRNNAKSIALFETEATGKCKKQSIKVVCEINRPLQVNNFCLGS